VKLNNNQPILFSYGPNGKDQLTSDAMAVGHDSAAASIAGDWAANNYMSLTNPLNQDNIYAHESLAEKLAQGL
jgi:hypothetical protein